MKAKALNPFVDKREGVTRNLGDTFTLSEERLKEINSTKFGVLAVPAAEEAVKPRSSKKPKRGD